MRVIPTLNPPQKYICKLRGLLPIHLMHWQAVQGLMWGARGPFPPVAAMVVAVVMPVVFCAKATEILKNAKKLKLIVFIANFYLKLYIVKHIKIHISLIVVWPEPKLSGS